MASQADGLLDFTNDEMAYLSRFLDSNFNSKILLALLYGIYTGILAITLWNIFFNKCWPIRRAMIILIILLYALTTISFAIEWFIICFAFIENGETFWNVLFVLVDGTSKAVILKGITGTMSSILTDSYMIWCCWMVWGRRWAVVLLPILFLIFGTVSKILSVYFINMDSHDHLTPKIFTLLYPSFILVTTLWCTLLIIYRILNIVGVKHRANGRLRVYQHFLEVLVESSALYSISLVVYLAIVICDHNNQSQYYFDAIVGIMKGVAPTLIAGRDTVRHRARPDDSWQGSVIGSASVRSQEPEHSQATFQEDYWTSSMLDGDLEAQHGSSVREPSPTLHSVSVVANGIHANTGVPLEASCHTQSHSLLHNCSSHSEDAIHDSVMVDKMTALN
ncbi:hypothetical protein IW261DRAFT_1607398 [Armillaria novae-zelandiae]|uniref:Transmembrane protein n=1 Tax=Armillaria novae-zelandiae TaxID=153914 RepID=A0AA39U973_9AGAR|nr:hypothetical protein IW261DRAFT_1607398 [Armillaria novae-zelandiae]